MVFLALVIVGLVSNDDLTMRGVYVVMGAGRVIRARSAGARIGTCLD